MAIIPRRRPRRLPSANGADVETEEDAETPVDEEVEELWTEELTAMSSSKVRGASW